MNIRWMMGFYTLLALVFFITIKAILLPFVVGLAVAYLLDPLADKLEDYKFPRWLATVTILFIFFVGFAGLIVGISPIVQAQISGIIINFPSYVENLRPIIENFFGDVANTLGINIEAETDNFIANATEQGLSKAGDVIAAFLTQGAAFLNLLTLLIISPVVAFFLVRDWDLIISAIDDWLPKKNAATVRAVARDVDTALAGFIRGQTLVSFIMAIMYAVGWTMVGLNYSLVLGIVAGILAYVPFVGALVAMLIAMLVGFGQFGIDGGALFPIFAVFAIVQAIEGAYLTPRLVGSRVGLHPVWVLFAIFAGGELMGFTGVLIALPVAAAVGVIVRFALKDYLQSDLHKGHKKTSPKKPSKAIKKVNKE